MGEYSHEFVETYKDMVAFGFDRKTDEATVQIYLQMFSDDGCMSRIIPRMSDGELEQVFDLISVLLRRHFSEQEYHNHFLKEEHEH